MKKKVLCMLLALCLFASFTLTAHAVGGDGVEPVHSLTRGLEISSTPSDAIAAAKNIESGMFYYYKNSADMITSFAPVPESNILPNYVIGPENRTIVNDAGDMPYSAICYLEVTFPDGESYPGTAFMIAEDVAMTAAHCLYNPTYGGWATQVKVFPGKSGYGFFNNPYGTAEAEEIVVGLPWFEGTASDYVKRNYDWGFIRLDENIGRRCGYFDLYYAFASTNLVVRTSGYPNDSEESVADTDTINYYQYEQSGYIDSYTDFRLNHRMDTEGGQSGSPIFYRDAINQCWRVVGVHVAGEGAINGSIYNVALRFTSQIYGFAVAYS